MVGPVSFEFIGNSLQRVNDELRSVRADLRDVRTIVLSSIDEVRRVRDDLELMIRSEPMGLETVLEREIGDLRERIVALEPVGD